MTEPNMSRITDDLEARAVDRVVFKGGRVIDPANDVDKVLDVAVENGRVVSVEKNIKVTKDTRVVDAAGLWVVPGLIDMHVHLREPGFEHKETVETGARAAAASGFATILAMPNTNPVLDTAQAVRYVRGLGRDANLSRVLCSAAITKGQKGEELAPMVELFEAGAVAFTDDGRPVENAAMMRRALEYASHVGLAVISHAEDLSLAHGGHMHEGSVSCHMGFHGIPSAAEEVCVARDLILCELTRGRLHMAHLSSRGSVRMVREAKSRGVNVTCEVTPHHFSLSHEAVRGYDTHAKMNPPLREPDDVQALIGALEDGTIDCIATDHAPHSTLEKDVPFDEAAFGIIGLETAVPLTLALVHDKRLSAKRAVALLTSGPAKCLGLPFGTLSPGAVADVTVIAPELDWTAHRFVSRSQNSPFLNGRLRGRAVLTMVAGAVVYENLEGT